jgi:AraC-like DNA-binding protein
LKDHKKPWSFKTRVMKPNRFPSRDKVRAAIAVSLRRGDASLRHTASRLKVSSRSLQRHLAATGTSYSAMVAEVRLNWACRLLVDSDERISAIASRLGYAEPSGFSRAFMRLMKICPIAYRRQNSPKH